MREFVETREGAGENSVWVWVWVCRCVWERKRERRSQERQWRAESEGGRELVGRSDEEGRKSGLAKDGVSKQEDPLSKRDVVRESGIG